MKLFLAILLCVGAALSNSTHYYGWQPQKELVFRYESIVNTRIPEIKNIQKAGLRLIALVRVQTRHDYSLMVRFEQTRFMTLNGLVTEERREEVEEPIPEPFKSFLEKPFKVHLRRGVVEALFVEKDEPIHVINIKKALVSSLNMDLSASRRAEIESNRLEIPNAKTLEQAPVDQSYFTVREQSLHGDCQTSYTVHPLPQYEAMEIEQQMEIEEHKRNSFEHLPGGLSQAKVLCSGKKYWQITKTRNLDNCIERPVFQLRSGFKSKCDSSKAACKDLMTHLSATNYIVCGNDIRDFVIRKAITENTITNVVGWKTEEQFQNKAKVVLELIKEETSFTPITPVKVEKEIKSLIFEYPQTYESHQSLTLSEQEKNQIEQESGIRPILPKPDLKSAPRMMVPLKITKYEIIRQVEQQMEKISEEIFESPESCSSKGDVAGHLNIISKALRPLSFDDLKEVESKIMTKVNSHQDEHLKKTLMHLFYDTLSMVGTNPAVMLIKERMSDFYRTDKYLSLKMLQTTLTNIRTPTQELLKELIQMVKTDLKQWSQEHTLLFNVAMVQMSKLIHKACVSPLSQNQFPVKVYGPFCNKDSQVVEEFISFLEQELDHQNEHIRLNMLAALGKIGHIKSVKVLSKIISEKKYSTMVRSLAVYSLKKSAMLEPAHVKPILLTIIDNLAEATEVRIAAIAVLPWSQPTTAELQKIAVRTWFEPSKQVASFIYSTFYSLVETEVPELKILSQKVMPLLTLVKPFEFGYQFSKNLNEATFVKYLDLIVSQKFTWTMSREQPIVPVRMSGITKIFASAFELSQSKFTVYTQGMDKLVDLILLYSRQSSPASQKVTEELEKISTLLNIKERMTGQTFEMFMQSGIYDIEYEAYLDQFKVSQIVTKLGELMKNEHALELNRTFIHTQATRVLEAETLGPCDAGFAIYNERSLPVVSASKASAQVITEEMSTPHAYSLHIPRIVKAKLVPVLNIQLEVTIGVISPFTQQLIGAGSEMAIHAIVPLEMTLSRKLAQITMDIKVPDCIQKEIEVVHAFVTPFTMRKSMLEIQPVSKSTDLKIVLSGEPLKETKIPFGQSLELDSKFVGMTDARYTDLYSYLEKMRQHSVVSALNTFYLPSTLRMSSGKILFNPQTSKTKEISFSVTLVKSIQNMSTIRLPFNSKSLTDKELIHEVCKENFPTNKVAFAECELELSFLEVIDEKVNTVCKKFPTWSKCQLLEKICDEARTICETKLGYMTKDCQMKTETCMKKILTVQQVQKVVEEFGGHQSGAIVTGIRMDASIKSQYGSKGVHAAASLGVKKHTIPSSGKEEIEVISNVEVKASTSPIYEVKLISKVEVPRVNNRWNTQYLVEEALQLLLNAQVQYGYENSPKGKIELKSTMVKSQQQKASVKSSPEYQRCLQEEQQGQRLTNVCEFSRHQAASIDEIKAEIEFPTTFTRSAWFYKAGDFFKYAFLGQMWVEDSIHTSETSLKLLAKVKRTGEEAQVEAEIAGRKYKIVDIRIPKVLRTTAPISMRNPLGYTIMQKLTRNQIPASCRVEPRHVYTFDNKTYSYEMNNCYHLLFKDCSQKLPIAILAKSLSSKQKEVKVLAGQVELIMTPKTKSEIKLQMNLEGRQEVILVQQGVAKDILNSDNEIIMQIMKYQDNVYRVIFSQEGLWVLFDGERVEISAPQLLKSRACGLCGDLDHENTADLKTPEKCLMSRPRYAAYSYMIPESCQGIPSQDKTQYEQERRECVKSEVIPTPLEKLTSIVTQKATKLIKPVISQHIVKKQLSQTCISVQRIKVCSKISQDEIQEPQPIKVQQKLFQFVCIDAPSVIAQSLEQRAKAGEALDMMAEGKPVAFSKVEYEPVICQRQSNLISGL